MRHRSLAAPFAFALLQLPLLAQGEGSIGMSVFVEIHSPTPMSLSAVRSVCHGARVRQAVAKALADVAVASEAITFEPGISGENVDAVSTTLRVHLALLTKTRAEVPAAQQDELFAKAVAVLEAALTPLTSEPIERDRKRLDELDQQGQKLEQHYLDLRQRAATMQRSGLANAGAIVADFEHQRLMVALDLRTEQGVLDYLQTALASADKQRNQLVEQRRELGAKRIQLRGLVDDTQKMLGGTKPEETERVRRELEVLQRSLAEIETVAETREAEAKRLTDHAELFASDAQKATNTLQRLLVRNSLLERMLDEQRKKLAEVEATAAARDLVLAGADDVKAQLTAVRQRADELRTRLASVEPLRIVRWN